MNLIMVVSLTVGSYRLYRHELSINYSIEFKGLTRATSAGGGLTCGYIGGVEVADAAGEKGTALVAGNLRLVIGKQIVYIRWWKNIERLRYPTSFISDIDAAPRYEGTGSPRLLAGIAVKLFSAFL